MPPSPPPPVRAVLFDLDGTLVDSAWGIARALDATLVERGCPALGVDTVRGMIGDGAASLLDRAIAHHGLRVTEAERDRLQDRLIETLVAVPHGPEHLYPEAIACLEALAAAGIGLALCTNKPSRPTARMLADTGLDRYLRQAWSPDTAGARKPAPLMLQKALAGLGVAAEQAVMVGDSMNDVRAGRSAGTRVAVVAWGYRKETVEEMGADLVIDRLGRLPALLSAG